MSGESSTVPASAQPYSLGAKCGSEALAMCLAIYLGLSIIANELLAKTKGNNMGWGFVSLGFGMAFGVAIMMFGFISAQINPAVCLALWVAGQMSAREFFALSVSEFGGAFVGAVLVWLHYLPHFKTVPEPPAETAEELLLRSRDALPSAALSIASYNTREERQGLGLRDAVSPSRALRDVRHFFHQEQDPSAHGRLLELALGRNELKQQNRVPALRRHSVQVSDMHRRLDAMNSEDFRRMMNIPNAPDSPRRAPLDSAGLECGAADSLRRSHSVTLGGLEGGGVEQQSHQVGIGSEDDGAAKSPRAVPAAADRSLRLYEAALVADKNAKLSIFCTRPAIYTPVFNFLAEFLCTVALVFGSMMLGIRGRMVYEPARGLFGATEGLWIGFFVFVCVLGLGGPTGIAANPARDFAPRLAHWLLPIPGKGSSEFNYAWIPVLAPFAGGVAAGGLYLAVQNLNHSIVPAMALCT